MAAMKTNDDRCKSESHAKLCDSFRYAFAGVRATAGERNFKIDLGIGVLAVVLGLAFRISEPEWLAILVFIGLVLGLECLNTSIEAVVDLVCPQRHPLAGLAKDAAAGASLCVAIAALVAGIVIFAPRILCALGLIV